jgi:hypothetical protein
LRRGHDDVGDFSYGADVEFLTLRRGHDDGGDFLYGEDFLFFTLRRGYDDGGDFFKRRGLSVKMEVFSCADLSSYINCDDEAFVALLQRSSLIRRNLRCKKANYRRYCNLRRREDAVLSHVFFCLRCRRQYSIVDGSFFATLKVNNSLVALEFGVRNSGGFVGHASGDSTSNRHTTVSIFSRRLFVEIVARTRFISAWYFLHSSSKC